MGDELTTGADVELDWLDQKLREEAPYIDDAGFTAGVMRKLPAQRATRAVRAWILLLAAIFASGTAYFLSGGGRFLFDAFARAELFSPLTILIVGVGIAFTLTCAAGFAALRRSDTL